ncbi:hypothetical protein BC941DRAFT_506820 [Chlamydoabsidia padenii]|nr:hypothetical protein BC941DRAFT_506820 [Chlamydoabsidia padenii]
MAHSKKPEDEHVEQPDYYDPVTTDQPTTRKYPPLFDNDEEELTLTIGHPGDDEEQLDEGRVRSFRIIDGYTPTLTTEERHTPYDSSVSSSGDNSPHLPGYASSSPNKSLDSTDNMHQQDQKQWLGSGAFTAVAGVRFPVWEHTFYILSPSSGV